ncbi:DUF4920 domain-containing protein [Psychroflexus sp. YR1-1]|uniref:DUF4920 domain-containing protein n=1 Tax=Psychroflexus aurantiacus TaxID=2709310 RepID=A0A6B3R128_9FLAO|nr:DUF4920 domain-containing protein [Psychroflexus aurantiacus]NEV93922.1 DUF4920 domain-containing protein [Psychroflexus aurantiacus]
MKKLFLLPILLIFMSCAPKDSQQENTLESENTTPTPNEEGELSIKTDVQFGEEFESAEVKSDSEMLAIYEGLSPGDSIQVQFQSEVQGVCAKKGCWMTLELPEEKNAHITFKGYGFFVPKDSKGHRMVVDGVAFIEQTDVETLRHYAEDAGKTPQEISKITEPQLNFRFIANGAKALD